MNSHALAAMLAALLLAVAATGPASAYDENSTSPVNIDADGLGLRGYDPVSYIADGAPLEGSAQLSLRHEGVTYRFSSEINRERFLADPSRYAPQYGGFCQTAAAFGKKVDADPNVWRVADGKLFLYVSEMAKNVFLEDVPGLTEQADAHWEKIKHIAPKDL